MLRDRSRGRVSKKTTISFTDSLRQPAQEANRVKQNNPDPLMKPGLEIQKCRTQNSQIQSRLGLGGRVSNTKRFDNGAKVKENRVSGAQPRVKEITGGEMDHRFFWAEKEKWKINDQAETSKKAKEQWMDQSRK